MRPKDYETDAGVRITFDALIDRGFDDNVVVAALDEYHGDLWADIFSPAVDEASHAIGLQPLPEVIRMEGSVGGDDPATFYRGKTFDRQQHRGDD